jgi:glycosyltransferase involved in cell wall biosynthesis
VATTAGGIGAVARDGVNALLVGERDVAALTAGIDALLRDPGLRAGLGLEARRQVLRDHGWDRVAEAFERAYRRARQR